MDNSNLKKSFEDLKRSLNKEPKVLKADCGHTYYDPPNTPAQGGFIYPFGEDKGKLLCYVCFMEKGIEHIESQL
jgi:hypothetical protein